MFSVQSVNNDLSSCVNLRLSITVWSGEPRIEKPGVVYHNTGNPCVRAGVFALVGLKEDVAQGVW